MCDWTDLPPLPEKKEARILVTGSREFTERRWVWNTLVTTMEDSQATAVAVVHGGARGADSLASDFCSSRIVEELMDEHGVSLVEEVHWADWDEYGKAAGFIRNQEMVDAGADICLAFLQAGAANRGTRDCMARVRKAGIPVRVVWSDGRVEPE